jgi:hypothetical protein
MLILRFKLRTQFQMAFEKKIIIITKVMSFQERVNLYNELKEYAWLRYSKWIKTMSSYIFGLHEIFTWLCDFSINYKWPGLTWKHVLFTKKVKDLIWLILRWSLYNIQSTITVTNIIFCWYSDVRFTLSWNDITFVIIIIFFSKL